MKIGKLYVISKLRLVTSANSPTVVELIVELTGELFIVELLCCHNLEFLKTCFKKIHYKNTLDIEKCLLKNQKIVK